MKWRTFLPKPIRLAYRMATRLTDDQRSGIYDQIARTKINQIPHFEHIITIKQPIMPSAYFENKIHNMRIANEKINRVLIMPGDVFSFWSTVGYPGFLQGFRKGRNLVNGQLRGAYGGGLCQVSGIIYYMALSTELEVLERHHHSVDIYAENERFAPLGSDATVVYGYKDLRIRNTTSQPVLFYLEVSNHQLSAQLMCNEKLTSYTPEFFRHNQGQQRTIQTTVNGRIVATSVYAVNK
jgi:vancomycin resistance protein VanW